MSKYTAAFAFVLVAGFSLLSTTPVSAQVSTTTASSTGNRTNGSTHPIFFFNELGIHTSMDAAAAVWQDGRIRQFIMDLWRTKVFGA